MSSVELFDELEAGELSVEFEGEEPQAVLEWAIERFAPRIAISTVVPDRQRRPDRHGLRDRSRRSRCSASTRAACRRRRSSWPSACATATRGCDLELIAARRRPRSSGMTGKHGVDLFKTAVDLRLLCCNVRKVRPLTKHLHTLDAWITGLRRDQWASRTNIRKVEIDHDHGAIVKLNPLAEWTEEEVWDYVREHDVPVPRALRPGLHVDRLRAVHARRSSRARRAARAAGGGSRARRRSAASTARSRAAGSSTSCNAAQGARMPDGRRSASAARRPRSRAPRRRPCWRWCRTRTAAARLADVIAAVDDGEVAGDDAEALARAARARPADRPHPRGLRARRRAGGALRSTAGCRAAAS